MTAHLEKAQTHSQELLEVIEKLSLENQNLKKAAGKLYLINLYPLKTY